MTITASQVNELRQKTGAGMMDCKKALTECAGDFEQAVDWLRKKGLSAAAKKSDRAASEGAIAVMVEGNKGAMIELNSETDFVAKNDKFQNLASELISQYIKSGDKSVEEFKQMQISSGKTVNDEIIENIAVIGENILLRRAVSLEVNKGVVVSYVHNVIAANLGKIGVLVALESELSAELLNSLGKQIAMHIAAAKPEALSVSDLDPAIIAKEKEIFTEQAKASGKPENVIEKMAEGRLAKFYEQVVLLEQTFIMDGKTKISQLIADFGAQNGGTVTLKAYERFVLGEGVEKVQTNLAEEVNAMVAGNQ